MTSYLVNQDGWSIDDRQNRDRIEVAFQHTHLPKLTEAGILEYDPSSIELCYQSDERLETILECLRSIEQA